MAKKPEKPRDQRRELEDDDAITVGAGNIDREPLPDDAYLDGVIRRLELRENVVNPYNPNETLDKLHIGVELPDFPDEHDEDGGNRFGFCSAKVSMHPKANLYKWVKNLLGIDPPEGAAFKPIALLNVPCRVLMKTWENEDGTTGQAISDFKPWKGKLKKGMKDPSEAAEEAFTEGEGGKKGSKKKAGKKTGKKTSTKKTASDGAEWFDEDRAGTIAEYLREGGKELVDTIASECGFLKKNIQAVLKGDEDVDGGEQLFNALFLLATNKHAAKFEGLAKKLEPWLEAAELDADDYAEWGTVAAHACAFGGMSEWPKTLKDLRAALDEGPSGDEEEEEEDEEEDGGEEGWAEGDRVLVNDGENDEWAGEVVSVDEDTIDVKADEDEETYSCEPDWLSEEEAEEGEEEESEDEDEEEEDEDDDGLGFLDED